ncbi:hypothetical protein GGI12_002273 [Dipsacomyces acuminosporus]|nr:hypothetical protein GGI12_002273 [Dipsacomyces acuminosporus]
MNLHKRVEVLGKEYNITVDPPGALDKALIIIGFTLSGITTLVVAYAWVHRNYNPIRAKRLPMTTIMHLFGVLWFWGDLVHNNHFGREGPWSHCKLWYIWFTLLTCYSFFTMVIIRFYVLERVFNQHKPFRGRIVYIVYSAAFLFHLALGLTGQLIDDKHIIKYVSAVKTCIVVNSWVIVALVIGFILLVSLIVLIIRLRNINSSFNEFRESLIIFLIAMGLIVEIGAIHGTHPMFPVEKVYRFITTAFDVVAVNAVILTILAHPVYMCIFHHQDYALKWRMKLNRDQLEKEYELTPVDIPTQTEIERNAYSQAEHTYYEHNRHSLSTGSNERIFTPVSGTYQNSALQAASYQSSEQSYGLPLAKEEHPGGRAIL